MKRYEDASGKDITSPVEGALDQEHHADGDVILEEEYAVADTTQETPDEGMPVRGDDVSSPSRFRFSPPMRQQVLVVAPFWAIILLAAVLRFWGLGDRPLHHDESMHAYFSLHFMSNWLDCFTGAAICYRYDPLLHGPFQFHAIALTYQIAQFLGVYDNGVNNFTARIPAALLGTVIVGLPYFVRDRLGNSGALIACFLLAVSPSMVYFSRFAREDIYMACFTLLLVVAVARYLSTRKMRWLIIAAGAFALSYATKEATFLTVAVFGSFFAALVFWELGLRLPLRATISSEAPVARYLPRSYAPVALLLFGIIAAPIAKFLLGWMKDLSIYITDPKHPEHLTAANAFVQTLKDRTVSIVPWIGIVLGIYVLSILTRELLGKMPLPGRRGIARWIDPEKQPLLDTVLTMPWTHWFFALLCGWGIFLLLFTVLFTNIRGGIGDGIWQGIYYWLQQQEVARGGQPWYYYLLLIPLYEQIGLVFGIVGIVYSLLHPTRFRLFLVYWFLGNIFIYTWAAEKMPWLMIHMTMPMMMLAAIGLKPIVETLIDLVKQWFVQRRARQAVLSEGAMEGSLQARPHVGILSGSSALIAFIVAMLLLLPTLHNMYEVTYVHAADAPHEMMIYVQTTTDIDIIMQKLDTLDKKFYGGRHNLPIGVLNDARWPFAWYLRDYHNVCLDYTPTTCPFSNPPTIITGGDFLDQYQQQYSSPTGESKGAYLFHQYHMRTQWDQGYMPPPCVITKTNPCTDPQPYTGVGPLLWLSYGDNPPVGATFNLGSAIKNIWQWWWERKAFGSTDGSYDMGLFIRKDLGVTP